MLPPGTMSSPLILVHKVLTNRRILLLLSQLALFGFVCWVILGAGSPTSSTNSLPLSPLPLNGAYSDSLASTAVFKGTFDRTSCPAMGCDYTPLVAAFETIHNGTAGAEGALIDQDRSKYEANAIIFNPSFMRMPAGSHWELMVVVRGPSITAMSGGYMQHRTVIAYFADLKDGVDIIQKTDSWMFDLDTDPSPGCEFPWGSTPGPEDPRLIWSPEGVPLVIVGMDTVRPEACRTMGVMDLRVLWPNLKTELDRLGWPATAGAAADGKFGAGEGADVQEQPLDRGTEVWFDGIGEREKNWAGFFSPFLPTEYSGTLPLPYFHYDFQPQALLFPAPHLPTPLEHNFLAYAKHVPSSGPNPTPSILKQCMERVQGNEQFQKVGFKVGDHHATPFHAVTLRKRGVGKKRRTEKDTVLVGLAHAKFFDDKKDVHFWYDRYVIVLNATAPFKPIAITPYLNITSLDYTKFYFTQSITFLPVTSSHPTSSTPSVLLDPPFPLNLFVPPPLPPPAETPMSLSDGYVDDDVLIALGETDGKMGSVRMSVQHMLKFAAGCGEDENEFQDLMRDFHP